ncbi:hypothetical protein PIROE2DRAFT_9093 [Piromyces sp. E2]|nr:hypothetical protein PIROE2DRAFT_9093 [Piromyces sp. E2]|eukprot:OUM64191.1 hypothetical protein PIROE2DRAFT_9093 [Piromyces sp. E2]
MNIKLTCANKYGCIVIDGSNFGNLEVEVTGTALNVYDYRCEFQDSSKGYALNKCVQVRGFVIDQVNIIRCNIWRRDGCTVVAVNLSATTCTNSGAEGDSNGAGTKICFGTSTSVGLPNDSTTIKHIAFSFQGEANTIFGLPKYKSKSNEVVKFFVQLNL